MPGRSGHRVPTDVTAVVKSQTNRARSVAAGVVSGAGSQPVFEMPHSDESAPSRTSIRLAAPWARQSRGRVRATGGAGHNRTHERSDGSNPSQ